MHTLLLTPPAADGLPAPVPARLRGLDQHRRARFREEGRAARADQRRPVRAAGAVHAHADKLARGAGLRLHPPQHRRARRRAAMSTCRKRWPTTCCAMLAHPKVRAARVSTEKPDVYPDCDAVGVEVFGLRAEEVSTQAEPDDRPADALRDTRKRLSRPTSWSKRLHREVGKAIADYNMIEAGDKVMVCLSGGKDSHALLDILLACASARRCDFELVAVNLDQKQPGFPEHVLPDYLTRARRALPHRGAGHLFDRQEAGARRARRCAACARGCAAASCTAWPANWARRRSRSATTATTSCVTLLMNMFFGGRLKGMPPKLASDDGRHVVIRPLAYVAETDLERWAAHRAVPHHPVHAVRQPGRPAARADQGRCCASGSAQ